MSHCFRFEDCLLKLGTNMAWKSKPACKYLENNGYFEKGMLLHRFHSFVDQDR